MRKGKQLLYIFIVLFLMTSIVLIENQVTHAKTKTKGIVICNIKRNKLTYRKSTLASKYLINPGFENIIGYGGKRSIRVTSKTKYYLLDYSIGTHGKIYKTTKKNFVKYIRKKEYKITRWKLNGKVYYYGTACKLFIKNGKVVKIQQVFQS